MKFKAALKGNGLTLNKVYDGSIVAIPEFDFQGKFTGSRIQIVIFNDKNDWVHYETRFFVPA